MVSVLSRVQQNGVQAARNGAMLRPRALNMRIVLHTGTKHATVLVLFRLTLIFLHFEEYLANESLL